MAATATTALTGKALLQKVKDLAHLSKRETAKECGYYRYTKDGKVRVDLAEFYDALLAARGVILNPEKPKDGRGREPSSLISVHKNGQLIVGAAYTKQMGLEPGAEFKIKLGYKHIHLIQLDGEGNEAED